jgi:hypothetical protein
MLGHPGIAPPRRRTKELHFFNKFRAREMGDADVAAYHELFPRAGGQVAGEWTPRYMRDFWTPRLLHRAAPDARLLVLLRDPIERFRSGMVHTLRRAPERGREKVATDAVERGRYASQLLRLREWFPDDRILVLQYEQCRDDPLAQFRRTMRFIGAAEDYEPPDLLRPRGGSTAPEKDELWPDFVEAVQATLEDEVRRLPDLVPDIDLRLWPNFAYLAEGRTARGGAAKRRAPAEPAPDRPGGPPDFVGVGVPGSGAEWWYAQLRKHPAIAGPAGEPAVRFFDQFCTRPISDADVAAYYERFPAADGTVCGEWTPRYALDAWTPPLLARVAPNARLLLMVNDPIERYRAQLALVGIGQGTHPTLDPAGPGRFSVLLGRLREHFADDRILVLQNERCRIDPAGEYARTLRFLGVSDGFRPRRLERLAPAALDTSTPPPQPFWKRLAERPPADAGPAGPSELWPDLIESLHGVLDREVIGFAAMVPELDLSLWPNFAHLAQPPVPACPS